MPRMIMRGGNRKGKELHPRACILEVVRDASTPDCVFDEVDLSHRLRRGACAYT
jgi:hypothetical protein